MISARQRSHIPSLRATRPRRACAMRAFGGIGGEPDVPLRRARPAARFHADFRAFAAYLPCIAAESCHRDSSILNYLASPRGLEPLFSP